VATSVRLEVTVADAAAVARGRARAIAIARGLGGTASAVPGAGPGRLVLRVPAAGAGRAVAGLSALGEVTGRRASAEDLTERTRQGDRQARERAGVATIDLTLAIG
jgi:hypothetical protein